MASAAGAGIGALAEAGWSGWAAASTVGTGTLVGVAVPVGVGVVGAARGLVPGQDPGHDVEHVEGAVADGEQHDGAAGRPGIDALDPLSAGLASYGTLRREPRS